MLAIGLVCLGTAAWLGTWLTPDWVRDNFMAIQILQIFGQPMVVIPTLMLAALGLGPADGPMISGMVNMLKGMANAIATALFEVMLRRREQYHSTMLLDLHGTHGTALAGMGDPISGQIGATSPDAGHIARNALQIFHTYVHEQSTVLALADIYLLVMWICAFFLVLTAILPGRVYAPRAPVPTPAAH